MRKSASSLPVFIWPPRSPQGKGFSSHLTQLWVSPHFSLGEVVDSFFIVFFLLVEGMQCFSEGEFFFSCLVSFVVCSLIFFFGFCMLPSRFILFSDYLDGRELLEVWFLMASLFLWASKFVWRMLDLALKMVLWSIGEGLCSPFLRR